MAASWASASFGGVGASMKSQSEPSAVVPTDWEAFAGAPMSAAVSSMEFSMVQGRGSGEASAGRY